jgi:asparagine synthase (glutamine-hydrolysing)
VGFVIYDRAQKRLFGSRDRFGKKPLYYFHEGETFGFASELPALLGHPDAPRQLSALSLKKYFAYCYIPAPCSIYERAWKLPGGHSFRYDLSSRELQTWSYWKYVIEPDTDGTSVEAYEEQIRTLLEAAVKRRLMSDVPLGVFLSGGIDSSAIAALAAKHVPHGQLNTFAIGFNEPSFDESAYARLVAERLGTRHREEILDLDRCVELLPEIVSRLDEPLGDGSLLPTYLLSRFTRKHVTVALGGDGGDELFAGYDPCARCGRRAVCALHSATTAHGIECSRRAAGEPREYQLRLQSEADADGSQPSAEAVESVWMSALEPREIAELFQEPTDVEELYSEAISAWDGCAQPTSWIDRCSSGRSYICRMVCWRRSTARA